MTEVWTKEQYLDWLRDRGKVGTWKHADCCAADEHIRHWALKNFNKYLQTHKDANIKPILWKFVQDMVRVHFGSANVHVLLIRLECYPDWMEKDEPSGS